MTVLAFLALPLAMSGVILTGRRVGLLTLVGSMMATQFLLHHTLMAATAQPASWMSGPMPDAADFAMGGQASAISGQAMTHAMTYADGWSSTMTMTHVVATVIMALLLARSEQALWQLVSRLLPTLPREPVLVAWPSLPTPVLVSLPTLSPSEMSGGWGLRGPPLRCVVAD